MWCTLALIGLVHTGIDLWMPQAGRKPVANGVAASHLLSAIVVIWPLHGHFISFFHLVVHSSTGFISDISLRKPDWRAGSQIRTNGLHLQKSCSNHDNLGSSDKHWKCFDTSKLPKLGNQAGVVHTGIDWASPCWHWIVDASSRKKACG